MMMKRILAVWLLTFVIITTGVCADNEVKDGPVDNNKKVKPVTEQKGGDAEGKDSVQKTDKDNIKMDVMEIANKAYMESVASLKWAIGGIIAIIGITVAAVGFVVVRHGREYKEVLDEARQARDKAGYWEEKARERFESIDKEVEKKLKEIDEKGKEQKESFDEEVEKKLEEIEEKGKESIEKLLLQAKEQKESLDEEAEKQRKVLDLWGKAIKARDDEDYELSANLWKELLEVKPDECGALNNWGAALLDRAKTKEGEERNRLLDEAQEILLKAEAIKTGSGSYNLACVFALRDDELNCRKWLGIEQEAGTLPTREYAMKDEDLKDMREKDWFGKMRWK